MSFSIYEPYCTSCEARFFIGYFTYEMLKANEESFVDEERSRKYVDENGCTHFISFFTANKKQFTVCDVNNLEKILVQEKIKHTKIIDNDYFEYGCRNIRLECIAKQFYERELGCCFKDCYIKCLDVTSRVCMVTPLELVLLIDKLDFLNYLKMKFACVFGAYETCETFDGFKNKFDLMARI